MIRFKYDRLRIELENAHPKLIQLVNWGNDYLDEDIGLELIISDVARTPEEEKALYAKHPELMPTGFGPHVVKPTRAADAEIRNDQTTMNHTQAWHLGLAINRYWQYDPERPGLNCCLIHDVGNGWHCHLQVHDRTRLRKQTTNL